MLVRPRSCNGLQGLALEWHVNLTQSTVDPARVASLHVNSHQLFFFVGLLKIKRDLTFVLGLVRTRVLATMSFALPSAAPARPSSAHPGRRSLTQLSAARTCCVLVLCSP